jgi:hypothetical protein
MTSEGSTQAAELIAVKRIFGLLPQDQATAFLELWEEFELSQTPVARFANSVDRAMPVLLNLANQGGSWLENGVSYERVVGRSDLRFKRGVRHFGITSNTSLRTPTRMAGSAFRSPEATPIRARMAQWVTSSACIPDSAARTFVAIY